MEVIHLETGRFEFRFDHVHKFVRAAQVNRAVVEAVLHVYHERIHIQSVFMDQAVRFFCGAAAIKGKLEFIVFIA